MMKRHYIVRNAAAILPYGIKSALYYRYEQYMYFRYLKQRFGDRFRWRYAGPLAPPELIQTEALMYADDLKARSEPQQYFGGGRRQAWGALSKVEQYGADVTSMRSILDSAAAVRECCGISDISRPCS